MRLVDHEFGRILDTLDRLDRWKDTIVIFTSDHGEMNGAHRMTQKGAIHFDEATIVNLTICTPGGPRGRRTAAVGSHLDLVPTLLEFAGLHEADVRAQYPHLKGRSLRSVVLDPESNGPRGSERSPGDGALLCWDGLHSLDKDWGITGALQQLTNMGVEEADPNVDPMKRQRARLLAAGERFGAPDFRRRTFFRTVVDGQYKLVRWFSPEEYGNPRTVEQLYASGDVTLHDLANDPGEMENLGHPEHPRYDRALVERMLAKLHALVAHEIGEDRRPFDLDMFGTREVTYAAPVEREVPVTRSLARESERPGRDHSLHTDRMPRPEQR
jgi:arylsulfatase